MIRRDVDALDPAMAATLGIAEPAPESVPSATPAFSAPMCFRSTACPCAIRRAPYGSIP